MRFLINGDVAMSVREARFTRRHVPEGVDYTLSITDEYEREIVRHYPITFTLSGDVDWPTLRETMIQFNLWPSDTPTMGTLDYDGWRPAIAFDAEEYIGSVYVTPIPEPVRTGKTGHDERAWERVRDTVITYAREHC